MSTINGPSLASRRTAVVALTLNLCFSVALANHTYQPNRISRAITNLLDDLLKDYNKHLRPRFGEGPLDVHSNMWIKSMGPISEQRMTFSLDCYFRQFWHDPRLEFKHILNISELRPSVKMLDQIWKPDTFFINGKNSYLHTITYPNRLFRISANGRIVYSQRLTIKTSCPMFLHKYPLDNQTCPLLIGSYAYGADDVRYTWDETTERPVDMVPNIRMAQFRFNKVRLRNMSLMYNNARRSILEVEFQLQREIGYYLLQIYLPCYLIVIISWISFLINREAVPARVTLGITTILTTCTIAITGRAGIPKVSYSTALDIFLLMCFSFVFAALIEYAGVNYFTRSGLRDQVELGDEQQHDDYGGPASMNNRHMQRPRSTTDINGHTTLLAPPGDHSGVQRETCWVMFLHCIRGNSQYRHYKNMAKYGSVSVSQIDAIARVIFPFSFICLNMLYWAGFMYYF